MRMIRTWVAAVVIAALAGAVRAETRVALVIGQAQYEAAPKLLNPARDAKLVAATLLKAGFGVDVVTDLTRAQMEAALAAFARKAAQAEVSVIYYAGHGIEVAGANYLIPVEARLSGPEDAPKRLVALGEVLRAVHGKTLGLVLLDACRENPFSSDQPRGLARIEPDDNTVVLYAAKDGTTAADGDDHSPFAASLAEHLATPGLELHQLFQRVRQDVRRATNNQQTPFPYGAQAEDFFFVGGQAGPARGADAHGMGLDAISGEEWATLDHNALMALILSRSSVQSIRAEAQAGKAHAQFALGLLHHLGGGGLPKNLAEAARLYKLAADSGDAPAQNYLGFLYLGEAGAVPGLPMDEREAARLFKLSAAQGNLAGMSNLATLTLEGRGGLVRDEAAAMRLNRAAADRGKAGAQAHLGDMYAQGQGGLAIDEREAVRLYRLSVEQRDPMGESALALMYLKGGGGLAQDEREAARLLKLAAQQEDPVGQYGLATIYARGAGGLPLDTVEAVRLMRLSAAQGFAPAQVALKQWGIR